MELKEQSSDKGLKEEAGATRPPWAVDELNLAEFPLAAISDRFLDGTKTVVFEETVWDYKEKRRVPRSLTISGSDRYGLPTAKDDDVLLACIQVSSLGDFASREVHFSRYELLKLLRWRDETRNYRRLSVALRRWKGLNIFSNRAFYDKTRESWVNKDFGVLDNLYIYEREVDEGRHAPASSWWVWNDVLFTSFRAGYLKQLDWDLYCRLESPVAKRLYRFLDKRFYHSKRVEVDLKELAIRKIRMSPGYNTAQMKRGLMRGIEELESKWSLKGLDEMRRFQKAGPGQWTVVFERRERRAAKSGHPSTSDPVGLKSGNTRTSDPAGLKSGNIATPDPAGLETELTRRGIGPAMAAELVSGQNTGEIQKMIELYDWYNSRGQSRNPGFLVQAIRNPGQIIPPRGFENSAHARARRELAECRDEAARRLEQKRELQESAAETARWERFRHFWEALAAGVQEQFETAAVRQADRIKRHGYYRSMGVDEQVFEHYRRLILRDHFVRTRTR